MLARNIYNPLDNLEKLPIDFFEEYRKGSSEDNDLLVIGDSWFNYPLVLKDITDYLSLSYKTYLISTTENFNKESYIEDLTKRLKALPKAKCIILSGEIYYLFTPNLDSIIDIDGKINMAILQNSPRFRRILDLLQKIFQTGTPIIIHGYEYLPKQNENSWINKYINFSNKE